MTDYARRGFIVPDQWQDSGLGVRAVSRASRFPLLRTLKCLWGVIRAKKSPPKDHVSSEVLVVLITQDKDGDQ